MSMQQPTAAKAIRVGLVVFSGSGRTATLADSVQEGIESTQAAVCWRHDILPTTIVAGRWCDDAAIKGMRECDALVFGCPTYFGGIPAQMKACLDALGEPFFQRTWLNRVAAGFTVSGDAGGDKAFTLMGLCAFAMQQGMIWAGQHERADGGRNRHGCYLGLGAQALGDDGELDPGDRATAVTFGTRIASITNRLRGHGCHAVHRRDP